MRRTASAPSSFSVCRSTMRLPSACVPHTPFLVTTLRKTKPLFQGNTILTCALVWLPYTLLVEVGVMVTTVPAVLQVMVFVHLRIKQPDMVRPYKASAEHIYYRSPLRWARPFSCFVPIIHL